MPLIGLDNDESGYFTSSRQSPVTRGSVIPSTRQVTRTSGTPQSRTDHDFGDVKTDTGSITIYKTVHRKLKIEQHEP